MPQEKESITFYRDGSAMMGKLPGTHIDKEYDVVQDQTDGVGIRTIVLREKDLAPVREKARKLADVIAAKIGESGSATVKDLLFDVFRDYDEKTIDKLLKSIAAGQPVKVREGCFKVVIGDGRRKDRDEIMLRE